jgi:8-oxo-dGTP pyrophosphatase MutT (NUDIX family)
MTEPAIPVARPAASMLFIRDGKAGIDVFMVVRNRVVDFAANAMVFPGGKVTPGDDALAQATPGGAHLAPLHRSHAVAAIRESFEEAGLLLAHDASGGPVSEARVRALDPLRAPIDKGQHSFADMLQCEDLTLQLGAVRRFAHIITPKVAPKRFDTHFYLAPAPAAHDAVLDMSEVVEGFWVTAADVLQGAYRRYILMKPTRMVLERLARSGDVAAAMADAAAYDPPAIEPAYVIRDGVNGLWTPEVQGFCESWESMDDIWAASVGKK